MYTNYTNAFHRNHADINLLAIIAFMAYIILLAIIAFTMRLGPPSVCWPSSLSRCGSGRPSFSWQSSLSRCGFSLVYA